MSNLLPQIIDPILTENPTISNEIKLEIKDEVVNEDTNVNEEEEEEVKEEELVVEKKPKIEQSVIFNDPPQVKPVAKKKRKMSEKQLENLAKARARSNELRKQRKAEKDAEVEKVLSQKKDEYVKSKVDKAVSKKLREVDKEQVLVNNNVISKDDIQDIVAQSILQYDTQMRTERAERKKKKVAEKEKERINNTIRRAQGLPKALTPQDEGYFNNCFG